QEKRLEAVWFERGDGEGDYFNFDGQTLRKTFLRAPIEFTRISSGFTLGRRHPVFRDWRAHRCVDYVAPSGTKIRVVGDGQVEYVGVQRGYGRVVIVKHDKDRSTLYAHMSKFAPNVKDGSRVSRGEVIGYVGQTGWASGPHLHFEFLLNGEPNDPAAVMPPPEAPLSVQAQLRFQETTGELLRRIRWEDDRVAAFE
ncbi:MAG: M23 family metallopeptidase, partial [Lautropia sp.]